MNTQSLKPEISEPIVVSQAPVEQKRWGYWQFPSIGYCLTSKICVSFNACEDSVTDLELPEPVGQRIGSWRSKHMFYRAVDLPPELANIHFLRCKKGSEKWFEDGNKVLKFWVKGDGSMNVVGFKIEYYKKGEKTIGRLCTKCYNNFKNKKTKLI